MTGSAWIAVALVALCGVAVVLFATSVGVGVTPDSVAYIAAARGLLQGLGLATPRPEGHASPFVFYAPLFPALLAAIGSAGVDPLIGARWLNAALFAANILLAASIIAADSGSIVAALCGAALLLISLPLLSAHAMAWSEPSFILLSLLALYWLSRYASAAPRRSAAAAGVAVGLAILSRYAGVFLIGVGLIVILAADRPRRARIVDGGVFAAISGLLAGLWLARNWLVARTLTDHRPALHPIALPQLQRGADAITGWWWLGASPLRVGLAIAAAALGALVAQSLAPALQSDQPAGRRLSTGARSAPVARTAIIFIAAYALFLPISISFVDAATPLDDRILAPALAWALIGGASAAAHRPRLRPLLAALAIWFAAAQMLHAVPWIVDAHRGGQGYATPDWQQSPTLARVRALPPQTRIFSNGDDAIYLLTGRLAERLPEQTHPSTAGASDLYAAELDRLRRRIAESPSVVVYLSRIDWRAYLISAAALQREVELQPLAVESDGVIYSARAR